MARPDDNSQMAKFLSILRECDGSAGNTALMHRLGWSEEEYWRLREKLLEEGLIIRGRGRGGSVILVEEENTESNSKNEDPVSGAIETLAAEKESDLYEPCLTVLREKWAQERNLHDVHVEITASQGRKKTGGIWTRPDIAAISVRTFTHWPGRIFDIWTFEIKPRWQFNVTGVFEAAAHSRSATHSYAMFQLPHM